MSRGAGSGPEPTSPESGRRRSDLELAVGVGELARDLDAGPTRWRGRVVGEMHGDPGGRVGDREERRRPETAGLGDHDAGHGHERPDRSAPRVGDGLAGVGAWRGRRRCGRGVGVRDRRRGRRRGREGAGRRGGRRRRRRAGVGDGDGVGLGVGVGSGVDRELPGQRGVEPVAGEARAAAVALAERPDRGDDVAGPDARAGPRGVADHEPERPAPVVDRDAEPVAQRVRGGGHRARYDQPRALERLAGLTGRRRKRSRQRLEPVGDDARRGRREDTQAEVARRRTGDLDDRSGLERRRERGVEADRDPAGRVLDEADPRRFDRPERRRERSADRGRGAVGQGPGVRDREDRRRRRRWGRRGRG